MRGFHVIFMWVVTIATLASAQTTQDRPAVGDRDPATEMRRNNGSLLKASSASLAGATPHDPSPVLKEVSFFAVPAPEPRTISKHDLVEIIVREESEVSSDGSTETKKDYKLNAAIEEWVKLNLGDFKLRGGGISGEAPAIRLNGNREFSGEGTVERSDSFIARIAAEVVDVKPNGNLVLQARKHIQTDEEEQLFILTGICRAEDVTIDNTILSTQLHDQRLQKHHKGAIRDANKRGFVVKLLDVINPF